MRNKQKNLPIAAVVPCGLAAGLVLAASSALAQPWATDSETQVLRTGTGGCWESIGGLTGIDVPESCGGVRDSDGDGVTDDKDKCPGTPKGVEVDADGCPLDSDGDGVPDYKDKCPGTPRGAPVDADGCPLDSDGDGVPDYRDKCPGTRPGAKVDANGCEIIESVTIDLVNDEFDFDSARLKPDMMRALDDVAAKIRASRGDEQLLVVGHTDSVGSEAYNQGLSERRAQAVADYLASKGVARGNITTRGMGESQPVADNGTAAGRAKNRRVEIETR
jgi:OOP family OmpA-OmpF porin